MSIRPPDPDETTLPMMLSSRLERALWIGWVHHAAMPIGCVGEPSGSDAKRPRRSGRQEEASARNTSTPNVPNLGAVETDAEGRVVYVDLRSAVQEGDAARTFPALRDRLVANRPTERVLDRLTPINRGRLLVEIEGDATLGLFGQWLRDAVAESSALRRLLEPLGPRLRLLGGQWIVPKATEYEPRILPQDPHTDVDAKGEVISVAIHVGGAEMGTLIDAKARVEGESVQGGTGFARAATPVFAYDTGAVHGGPGVAKVAGPYPRYFVERVFFLLSSNELSPERIAQHRRDNGLRGAADMVVTL
jgi:hypothetical protein